MGRDSRIMPHMINASMSKSVLVCENCDNPYIVYKRIKATYKRKKNKKFAKGHVKHMYCAKCKEIHAHIQLSADEARYNY